MGQRCQVGGGVWGLEGARLVDPGISQILSFRIILAKLSKIKLLLLIDLKFLSSLAEKLLVFTLFIKKNILQKLKQSTNSETKTCTEV